MAKRHIFECLGAVILIALIMPPAKGQEKPAPAPSNEIKSTSESTPPIEPTPPRWSATIRSEAAAKARLSAGRPDPFSPVGGASGGHHGSFSGLFSGGDSLTSNQERKKNTVPPPPPTTLLPPPPAVPSGSQPGDGSLPLSELPEPPAKPDLAPKLRLVGIIGERAIFALDDEELRSANGWPAAVSLSPGDQFDSLKVISASADGVTVEENGQQSVIDLPRIR